MHVVDHGRLTQPDLEAGCTTLLITFNDFLYSKSASSLSSMSKATPSFMNKTESSSDVTPVGQWDFEEPFKRTSCSCTSSSNISR